MTRRTPTMLRAAVLATALVPGPLFAYGADYYFIGPNNSLFSDPANWSTSPAGPGGTPPSENDAAIVYPSTSLSFIIDRAPNAGYLGSLSLSAPAGKTLIGSATDWLFVNSLSIGANTTIYASKSINSNGGHFDLGGPSSNFYLGANGMVLGFNRIVAGAGSTVVQGGYMRADQSALIGGSYFLYNGILDGAEIDIDAAPESPATFQNTGGITRSYYDILIGRNSTYTLSGYARLEPGNVLRVGGAPTPSPASVPDTFGATLIQTGGTVTLSDSYDGSPTLVVNANTGSTARYSLSDGIITSSAGSSQICVGSATSGTFDQTGGTVTTTNVLLGDSPGALGTYNLAGSGQVSASRLQVGNLGTGTLTLADTACLSLSAGLFIASAPGSSGAYRQSGGTLTAASLVLGQAGNATASLSGGSISATFLALASAQSSSASYSMTSGSLSEASAVIGDQGQATFTQSGGTHVVTGTFASSGTLTLANSPAANASYSLSGFAALSTPNMIVGKSGHASVTQSGGTVSAFYLTLALRPGSGGSYSLSSGSLSTGITTVGEQGPASFVQSGGTHAMSYDLNIANDPTVNASYTLSGGSLTSTSAYVGLNGHGTFTQTGGEHRLYYLTIAANPGSAGTYDLLGGRLISVGIVNNGTFYMGDGGTLVPAGPNPYFINHGSATFAGNHLWPANSWFSNTLVAYFHSDPGSAGSATLNVTSASPDWAPVVFDAPAVHLASLALSGDTRATVPASAGTLLSTRALSITDAGRLDLADNTLVVDYAGAGGGTPVDEVRGYLLAGRLASSLGDAGRRLGYVDSGAAVTVRLTLAGDANLDGVLDGDDYALLDQGFAAQAATWQQGDFDYDGRVTSGDFLLIDVAYGRRAGGFSPEFLAGREAQFGAGYVAELVAGVPEPSAVVGAAAGVLLVRRWGGSARRGRTRGGRPPCAKEGCRGLEG